MTRGDLLGRARQQAWRMQTRLAQLPLSLCAALVCASRWESAPVSSFPQISVGRIFIGLIVAAAGWEVLRGGGRVGVPATIGARLFLAGMLGEALVIVVNVVFRGHNTGGALYGFLELMFIGLAALAAARSHPEARVSILLCAAVGALLGSLDAFISGNGVQAIHDSTLRVSGAYGNPNILGSAASLGVPVVVALAFGLAHDARWRRGAFLLAAAFLCVTIFATYSRSAIVGTVAGLIAVVALFQRAPIRRVQFALGLSIVAALVAVVAFPAYEHLRSHADFGNSVLPDRSGWNPNRRGLIAGGPAKLSNPSPDVLRITGTAKNEGASFPLAGIRAGHRYTLRFNAAAPKTEKPLAYGIEDDYQGGGPPSRVTSTASVSLQMHWRPAAAYSHARAYFWLPTGGEIDLSGLRLTSRRLPTTVLPTRLLGTTTTLEAQERRYLASRADAAHLALTLFVRHPILGVGWQQFTSYSARRLHFGTLATHDEYLRFMAELGLPGIVFLLMMIAAVIWSALVIEPNVWSRAAVGCVVSGAVGLLFINGLETPDISLPLLVSAAILCAGVPERQTVVAADATVTS